MTMQLCYTHVIKTRDFKHTMRILYLLIVFLFPLSGSADKWSFPAELITKEFVFGEIKIERTIDARSNQTTPIFQVDIYNRGILVGRYGGVYFEDIAASEDNKLFAAISNSGLANTAIILFDEQGRVHTLIDHSSNQHKLDYCERSVTVVRKWYDPENPSLKFFDGKKSLDIQVRNCRGEVISLLDLLS